VSQKGEVDWTGHSRIRAKSWQGVMEVPYVMMNAEKKRRKTGWLLTCHYSLTRSQKLEMGRRLGILTVRHVLGSGWAHHTYLDTMLIGLADHLVRSQKVDKLLG